MSGAAAGDGTETFDYIVVGGGSAGCIVAARLARLGAGSVLLLEAGDRAEDHPETLDADGYKTAFANDDLIWERHTVPQAHCGGRRLFAGSGTGMGGSGSVNGMVYTRGDRRDYDQWPAGWQWADVEPAFAAVEDVLHPRSRDATAFTRTAIAAAETVGFRHKDGLNDGDLGGYFGHQWMNYQGDRRRSSYVGFVKDAELAALTVHSRTQVRRIVFDDTRRAVGVVCANDGGGGDRGETIIRCTREVVLCAGALETPKLLMLSGVGPAADLKRHGVEVVADDARIGDNFQDHPNVTLFFKGEREVDAHYPLLYGFTRTNVDSDHLPAGQPDTCYVMYPARSSLIQAMKRMLPALMPRFLDRRWLRALLRRTIDAVFSLKFMQRFVNHMYGVVVILGKPKSRGKVRLASADPDADLAIDPNYYAEGTDLETMLRGVAKARAIAASPPFAAWGNRALMPGAGVTDRDKLVKWIHGATMTTFHYSGTCAMGAGDDAPVDLRLRVKAVSGVRVADAAAIPVVPVAAINAPSMMLAYRAAAMIAADAGIGESAA